MPVIREVYVDNTYRNLWWCVICPEFHELGTVCPTNGENLDERNDRLIDERLRETREEYETITLNTSEHQATRSTLNAYQVTDERYYINMYGPPQNHLTYLGTGGLLICMRGECIELVAQITRLSLNQVNSFRSRNGLPESIWTNDNPVYFVPTDRSNLEFSLDGVERISWRGYDNIPVLAESKWHNNILPASEEFVREGIFPHSCNCIECLVITKWFQTYSGGGFYASIVRSNVRSHKGTIAAAVREGFLQSMNLLLQDTTLVRLCRGCNVPIQGAKVETSTRVITQFESNPFHAAGLNSSIFSLVDTHVDGNPVVQFYCENCWRFQEQEIPRCLQCNTYATEYPVWMRNNESRTEESICPVCYVDSFYLQRCSSCSYIFSTREDEENCWRCEIRSRIHNYSYTPTLKFFGFPSKPKEYGKEMGEWEAKKNKALFLGIEIEAEVKRGEDRNLLASDFLSDAKSAVYLKEDGSIHNGFEIVSHPATIEWWQDKDNVIFKSIESHLLGKMKSFFTTNCGIHIHMSLSAFSRLHLMKFMKFIYNNELYCQFIAQRTSSYAKFSNSEKRSVVKRAKLKAGNADRYVAVNFPSTKPTIEIRIFRGNLKPKMILKNLEFLAALYEFSKDNSALDMKTECFLDWVEKNKNKYKALHDYNSNFRWKS